MIDSVIENMNDRSASAPDRTNYPQFKVELELDLIQINETLIQHSSLYMLLK